MGGDANQSLFNRALPVSLPKVQAWRVRPPAPEPRGVEDSLYEKFGYNDIDEVWQPTTTYARWVQPSQEELAKQVEYDLPLEGKIWLDKVNIKRKQEGLDEISYEFLEIVLDKLEKEWFDLSRHFPKRDSNMLVEDSKCTICDDGECEASNAIVFCDGCNLAVHQGEYAAAARLFQLNTIPERVRTDRYVTSVASCRLLWCTVHPRGSMAVQEVHCISWKISGKSCQFI